MSILWPRNVKRSSLKGFDLSCQFLAAGFLTILLCALINPLQAEDWLTAEEVDSYIEPPYQIGEPVEGQEAVWNIINLDGVNSGYAFETEALSPLPGFSGEPVNILVILNLDGLILDLHLIEQREPIFVSGLGEVPFRKFLEQYRGLSIADQLVVGTPYGKGGQSDSLVYLDGVTKATASVRIAHESILAAALKIAREKMKGIGGGAAAAVPDYDHQEDLVWTQMVEEGIAHHFSLTNQMVQAAFADTVWDDDDADALDYPDELFLDLWAVDITPPSVAQSVLKPLTLEQLDTMRSISPDEEFFLLIETARHGLVQDDFIRNTSPSLIQLRQNDFPLALRDSDLDIELHEDLPDGRAMIFRTDRRLGYDPLTPYDIRIIAQRAHGMFHPEIGEVFFDTTATNLPRFYKRLEMAKPLPAWLESLRNRWVDMTFLAIFLAILGLGFWRFRESISESRYYTPLRLGILAITLGFIGWWGQGQLSIVTVMGTLRSLFKGESFAFLLYDPFSLLLWAIVIISFFLWGRSLFCGWLCPYGALQEFFWHLGKKIPFIKQYSLPEWLDARLKYIKYFILALLLLMPFVVPEQSEVVAEIEPFKTAITVYFDREWFYVLYALSWLIMGMVVFKPFCRYICPLGASMALGGLLRRKDWIKRRTECGSPCQLCTVRCDYQAIEKSGKVQYSECFGCLDCVQIYRRDDLCVPLVLAGKRKQAGEYG